VRGWPPAARCAGRQAGPGHHDAPRGYSQLRLRAAGRFITIGARSRPGLDAQRPGRCPSRTRAGPWLKRPRAAWSADPRTHLTAADPGGPLPALIVPRPPVADRDSASRALGTCIHSEAPPGTHDMEHSAPSRPFPGADGLPRRAHNRFAGCRPDPAGGVSIPNRRGTRSTLSALEAPAPHCACREAHASRPSSPGRLRR
jgi:hypothetical protein